MAVAGERAPVGHRGHAARARGVHGGDGHEGCHNDDAGRTWARRSHEAIRPSAAAGEYVNFLGDADARSAALTAYGEAKLKRLGALKKRWDPDNVFRFNHNLQPAD